MECRGISREYVSIAKRTVEEQLYNELVRDYGFPRAICRSLVELFFSYFNLYLGADRADGQLVYRAVPADVPPGIKTEEIKTHPVRLTLFSLEDIPYASKDIGELTKRRIERLTNEAFDQGGLLTQADLAILLGESPRTIGRRIQDLEDGGIIIPTRGNRMDIGPGISHKTKIVEMYTQGYEFSDIKRRTRHSSESITRYLKDFARVMVLHERGHNPKEIRIITEHSDRLVREYLELYEQLNVEENQEMLDQLRAMYREKKNDGPGRELKQPADKVEVR
ncbi:MAG: DUF1670 domain-containing protein [Candidatus Thermoplasmatota archaeon]